MENEDVVGAAPTGDTPTTSEWSTILLPTKVHLREVWRYLMMIKWWKCAWKHHLWNVCHIVLSLICWIHFYGCDSAIMAITYFCAISVLCLPGNTRMYVNFLQRGSQLTPHCSSMSVSYGCLFFFFSSIKSNLCLVFITDELNMLYAISYHIRLN